MAGELVRRIFEWFGRCMVKWQVNWLSGSLA